MNYDIQEIKQGIKIHYIKTNKFKTNLLTILITMPLSEETVTQNTVLAAVLKRGTKNLKTQEEINKKLEKMYGASLDCGVEKIGDNHVIKFYVETLNDNFTLKNEKITDQTIGLLLDILFNPLVENDEFNEDYVNSEKNNIKQLIEGKINNKDIYALDRCIEQMYKDKPYGLYKYGRVEDLQKINAKNLYKHYKQVISTSKIDMFISGDIDKKDISNILEKNENIQKLEARKTKNIINNEETEIKKDVEVLKLEEKMNISQGKLVIGLDVNCNYKNAKYPISLYNVILGESATSKLFQNVREKASLAYSARSNYIRQKSNIFIRCGIEVENYEKALKIIKQQLEDMENGAFTEEDLEDAKKYMISGVRTAMDEQDSEITYYIGQELSGNLTTFEEYIEKINGVTMRRCERCCQKHKNKHNIFFKELKHNTSHIKQKSLQTPVGVGAPRRPANKRKTRNKIKNRRTECK